MSPLAKIKRSSFDVSLVGDCIEISPFSKLTPPQIEFLKLHKAEILNELSINSLAANEETAILAWLASIDETDPAMIVETLDSCRSDPEAKAYFLGRAKEAVEAKANELQMNIREAIKERAGILEHDCGLLRSTAEQEAIKGIRVYTYRHAEKPNQDLIAILPGCNLAEAEASLKGRFGDDLIFVLNEYSAWRVAEMDRETHK
jgi:hypothetical protein